MFDKCFINATRYPNVQLIFDVQPKAMTPASLRPRILRHRIPRETAKNHVNTKVVTVTPEKEFGEPVQDTEKNLDNWKFTKRLTQVPYGKIHGAGRGTRELVKITSLEVSTDVFASVQDEITKYENLTEDTQVLKQNFEGPFNNKDCLLELDEFQVRARCVSTPAFKDYKAEIRQQGQVGDNWSNNHRRVHIEDRSDPRYHSLQQASVKSEL